MSGTLTQAVVASLPAQMTLPLEIAAALEWCDRNGCVRFHSDPPVPFAFLYPDGLQVGRSTVSLQPYDRRSMLTYTGGNATAADRLALIVRTGGEGSAAGLWLDDAGIVRVVHVGSGSGSMMCGTLCDSVVDFLRLLAIGYLELCWQDDFKLTPEQVLARSHPDWQLERPHAFRAFVEATFDTRVPDRGIDIVKRRVYEMTEDDIADPFARWFLSLT